MESNAVDLLNQHRVMTIATLRPDGWPQATMVGYANDGLLIYFIISRRSQKFENIRRDERVSLAIGKDFKDPQQIRGLSIAARASEVTNPTQRRSGLKLVLDRHPELAELGQPDFSKAALMRASCNVVTILDYEKGFGHADLFTVGAKGIVEMQPSRPDDWGFTPSDERKGRYERAF